MNTGLYQHYRGNYYLVMGISRHSETLEEMVVYRSLYGDYGLWVRPKDLFESTVDDNGKQIPRFKFINAIDTIPPAVRD